MSLKVKVPIAWFGAGSVVRHAAVVCEGGYKIGQTEFRTQVTKIQNANPAPDVIFTPMFVPDSGIFLKALRGAGVS